MSANEEILWQPIGLPGSFARFDPCNGGRVQEGTRILSLTGREWSLIGGVSSELVFFAAFTLNPGLTTPQQKCGPTAEHLASSSYKRRN